MIAWLHDCMVAWLHGCMVAWLDGCLDEWVSRFMPDLGTQGNANMDARDLVQGWGEFVVVVLLPAEMYSFKDSEIRSLYLAYKHYIRKGD